MGFTARASVSGEGDPISPWDQAWYRRGACHRWSAEKLGLEHRRQTGSAGHPSVAHQLLHRDNCWGQSRRWSCTVVHVEPMSSPCQAHVQPMSGPCRQLTAPLSLRLAVGLLFLGRWNPQRRWPRPSRSAVLCYKTPVIPLQRYMCLLGWVWGRKHEAKLHVLLEHCRMPRGLGVVVEIPKEVVRGTICGGNGRGFSPTFFHRLIEHCLPSYRRASNPQQCRRLRN